VQAQVSKRCCQGYTERTRVLNAAARSSAQPAACRARLLCLHSLHVLCSASRQYVTHPTTPCTTALHHSPAPQPCGPPALPALRSCTVQHITSHYHTALHPAPASCTLHHHHLPTHLLCLHGVHVLLGEGEVGDGDVVQVDVEEARALREDAADVLADDLSGDGGVWGLGCMWQVVAGRRMCCAAGRLAGGERGGGGEVGGVGGW
jgi:hypothetical protein